MTSRALIYARYSSDLSRDASIEDQLRLCRAHAECHGWNVVKTCEDRAISGASTIRAGYQEMLEAARSGAVDIVLAEALDRLSRDQEDIAALHKRLKFLGVKLVTVSEGEIGELHIGLKGTMNALYLKDLADKTRRGLEGRVRAGRSGGGLCYGYEVIPGEERGGRRIKLDEAATVRRIFEEFASGRSPKAIARRLNEEGIPGPRGALWRDTAIRGHRARGTGILNNELYVGRLVWNRLRYIKDPQTGRRVSRRNDPEDWIIEDVPDLHILEDELWQRAKTRQEEIDAEPRVQAIKASRFWEHRRATHLLTGLVRCASCGGHFTSIGRDYLACANARKLHQCNQRKSVRRQVLENFVLDLIRDHLMQPDAVRAFISAYHRDINAGRDAAAHERGRLERKHSALAAKLDGLYDAVADGLRTPGLLAKIEDLEAEKTLIEAGLDAPAPPPVRLHPNLAELYREKVTALHASLADPLIRDEAIDLLRGLIDEVRLGLTEDGWSAALQGEITALVALGMQNDKAPRPGLWAEALCSAKVVAGAGFDETRTHPALVRYV
jgi:DNA invertase Pin-like site-specific DNA recombinase